MPPMFPAALAGLLAVFLLEGRGALAQTAAYSTLSVRAPVVSSLMASLPGTNAFFMHERPQYPNVNVAGVLDLTISWFPKNLSYSPPSNSFCGCPVVLGNGNVLLAGGANEGAPLVPEGWDSLVVFNGTSRTFTSLPKLAYRRWYPMMRRSIHGKVSIVAGTYHNDVVCKSTCGGDFCNPLCRPAANEEVSEDALSAGTAVVPYPQEFVNVAGQGWYPFMANLPQGDHLLLGMNGGAIYTPGWQLVQRLPPLPAEVTWAFSYPYTASVVMLPFLHSNGYQARVAIFGGQTPRTGGNIVNELTPASDKAIRLELPLCADGAPTKYCPTWSVEDMLGYRRVLGDAVNMPNGMVLVNGGAMAGTAGLYWAGYEASNASYPQLTALQYNPAAAAGSRFSVAAVTRIPRLYHSAACLELGGAVLVTGCEVCRSFNGNTWANISASPTGYEKRVELLTPNVISGTRPSIATAPATITRGGTFTVMLGGFGAAPTISYASLVAPCAVTHSVAAGGTVVTLQVTSQSGKTVTLRAPPADLPGVALIGWHKLFVVSSTGAYSRGVWLRLRA